MDKQHDAEKGSAPPASPDGASSSSEGIVADATLAALQRVRTADEHHPIHWSSFKKWFITFWYCALQAFVTLTTTTYVSAEFLVQEQFGGSTQLVTLGQSMFIIGTAIGPAFLGPLSYVLSLFFFFVPQGRNGPCLLSYGDLLLLSFSFMNHVLCESCTW